MSDLASALAQLDAAVQKINEAAAAIGNTPPAQPSFLEGSIFADAFGRLNLLGKDGKASFFDSLQTAVLVWELDGGTYRLAKRDDNQGAKVIGGGLVTIECPGYIQPGKGPEQLDTYLHPAWKKKALLRFTFFVQIANAEGLRLAAVDKGVILLHGKRYSEVTFKGTENVGRFVSLIHAGEQWEVYTDATYEGVGV